MTDTLGREALLSDDDLMAIIRACGLNGPMRIATIRARWKDGIDIDEPSHDVRRLADAIALRLASKPSDEVREALILSEAGISAMLEMHGPDPAGLLLLALNKVDRSLATTGETKP